MSRSRRRASPAKERGVALVVALLLLLIITMVAFVGLRGTLQQQKMAAHQHDRQLAFQHAEAALRVAQSRIASHPEEIARHCRATSTACLSNPFNDPGLPAGSIHTVENHGGDGSFTASVEAAGQPQYVIEHMGDWVDTALDAVVEQSANAHNYGDPGALRTTYRITARSSDPAVTGDRMLVVLQATIEQRR
ncbi:pilus assembly PilX family protein [Dyella japonica]|uniref:Pilus assembly protein n=1 Tax=Dyella japonica A8 TaxID=1217721 RepID=A0A075K3W7_9GAMM|nr:PilX N-terminal domain-containing pilus assembly protein [Dyella japonica]AIF48884.1 pilus assembly protein [Dyella japonica A8]